MSKSNKKSTAEISANGNFPVHQGDELYLGNRRIVVLRVNRDVVPHRVLIGTRKNAKSRHPWICWVDACRLQRRPDRLMGADHRMHSLAELLRLNGGSDLIDWEPGSRMPPGQFAPTDALPGSWAKVEALAQRVRLGQPLWHPNDATYADMGAEIAALGGTLPDIRQRLSHIPNYVPKQYQHSARAASPGVQLIPPG